MKNVLFASTALVAFSATAAAADISLSGSAELGLTMNNDAAYDEVTVHTDVDLVWTLTGTTDNGLTFGANIDWDEAPTEESAAVFISGAFGSFTAGDTDSALAANVASLAGGGLADEADNAIETDAFDGLSDVTGGQTLRYDVAFGPATVSASYANGSAFGTAGISAADAATANASVLGDLGLTVSAGDLANGEIGEQFALGASATFSSITVGAGFLDWEDVGEAMGASVEAGFGPAAITAHYLNIDADSALGDVEADVYGLSGTATFGIATVGAQYQITEVSNEDEDTYGIWVDYALGGGATFTISAGETYDDQQKVGFGVGMSF